MDKKKVELLDWVKERGIKYDIVSLGCDGYRVMLYGVSLSEDGLSSWIISDTAPTVDGAWLKLAVRLSGEVLYVNNSNATPYTIRIPRLTHNKQKKVGVEFFDWCVEHGIRFNHGDASLGDYFVQVSNLAYFHANPDYIFCEYGKTQDAAYSGLAKRLSEAKLYIKSSGEDGKVDINAITAPKFIANKYKKKELVEFFDWCQDNGIDFRHSSTEDGDYFAEVLNLNVFSDYGYGLREYGETLDVAYSGLAKRLSEKRLYRKNLNIVGRVDFSSIVAPKFTSDKYKKKDLGVSVTKSGVKFNVFTWLTSIGIEWSCKYNPDLDAGIRYKLCVWGGCELTSWKITEFGSSKQVVWEEFINWATKEKSIWSGRGWLIDVPKLVLQSQPVEILDWVSDSGFSLVELVTGKGVIVGLSEVDFVDEIDDCFIQSYTRDNYDLALVNLVKRLNNYVFPGIWMGRIGQYSSLINKPSKLKHIVGYRPSLIKGNKDKKEEKVDLFKWRRSIDLYNKRPLLKFPRLKYVPKDDKSAAKVDLLKWCSDRGFEVFSKCNKSKINIDRDGGDLYYTATIKMGAFGYEYSISALSVKGCWNGLVDKMSGRKLKFSDGSVINLPQFKYVPKVKEKVKKKEKLMSFEDALGFLKSGLKVSRKIWGSGDMYLKFRRGWLCCKYLRWQPCEIDILANDWYVVR